MSESMGNIGKPDAKARGGKGRLDWEHSVGTPPASWERPRADSVRIVEHVPVCQLAVESFENPWVCSLFMAILLDLAPMRATFFL